MQLGAFKHISAMLLDMLLVEPIQECHFVSLGADWQNTREQRHGGLHMLASLVLLRLFSVVRIITY